MLEPFGLVVDLVDVYAQCLREIELQQPVVPDHLERDLLARRGQRDAALRLVHGEIERGEFLDHLAG